MPGAGPSKSFSIITAGVGHRAGCHGVCSVSAVGGYLRAGQFGTGQIGEPETAPSHTG